MNKRLEQFLAAENISQSQFADIIGVTRANVSHVLAGRNKPGYDFIHSTMTHFPALNLEWLLAGQGKMYKSPLRDDTPLPTPPLVVPIEEDAEEEDSEDTLLPFSDISNTSQVKETEQADNQSIIDSKMLENDPTPVSAPIPPSAPEIRSRRIEKIIVMYDDGSFEEIV